jgi:hypothetical protein
LSRLTVPAAGQIISIPDAFFRQQPILLVRVVVDNILVAHNITSNQLSASAQQILPSFL